MKKILFISIAIFLSQIALADMCTLTVIAESGLSLRKEANLKAEKLEVVQFGETVLSNGVCNFNYPRFTDEIIEIDGRKGFWMKVRFKKIWGYMFSGYLVVGDIYPYTRIDTIDNVILDQIFIYEDEGVTKIDSFDYRYYTPKLNWYGIKVNGDIVSIKRTQITPIYNNNRWNSNNKEPSNVYLQVKSGKDFDFLFGTKRELKEGVTATNYHKTCENKRGIFLYPEQEYSIVYQKKKYTFRGYERIFENKDSNGKRQREYTLKLNIWNDEIKIENVKNILNLHGNAKINAVYQSPKIYWSGDINRDGYLDFVFEVSPMADKCGAFPYLVSLLSFKDLKGNIIYKSANGWVEYDNFKPK